MEGYAGKGYVRFIGKHRIKGQLRVGVELDEPLGRNNGSVDGYQYFDSLCAPQHGVLVIPRKVHPAQPPVSLGVSSCPSHRDTCETVGETAASSVDEDDFEARAKIALNDLLVSTATKDPRGPVPPPRVPSRSKPSKSSAPRNTGVTAPVYNWDDRQLACLMRLSALFPKGHVSRWKTIRREFNAECHMERSQKDLKDHFYSHKKKQKNRDAAAFIQATPMLPTNEAAPNATAATKPLLHPAASSPAYPSSAAISRVRCDADVEAASNPSAGKWAPRSAPQRWDKAQRDVLKRLIAAVEPSKLYLSWDWIADVFNKTLQMNRTWNSCRMQWLQYTCGGKVPAKFTRDRYHTAKLAGGVTQAGKRLPGRPRMTEGRSEIGQRLGGSIDAADPASNPPPTLGLPNSDSTDDQWPCTECGTITGKAGYTPGVWSHRRRPPGAGRAKRSMRCMACSGMHEQRATSHSFKGQASSLASPSRRTSSTSSTSSFAAGLAAGRRGRAGFESERKRAADLQRELRTTFTCPISLGVYEEPVITKYGNTYEKEYLMMHLKMSSTDPVTRQPLGRREVVPNSSLKRAIEHWRSLGGRSDDSDDDTADSHDIGTSEGKDHDAGIRNVELLHIWRREHFAKSEMTTKHELDYYCKKCNITEDVLKEWIRRDKMREVNSFLGSPLDHPASALALTRATAANPTISTAAPARPVHATDLSAAYSTKWTDDDVNVLRGLFSRYEPGTPLFRFCATIVGDFQRMTGKYRKTGSLAQRCRRLGLPIPDATSVAMQEREVTSVVDSPVDPLASASAQTGGSSSDPESDDRTLTLIDVVHAGDGDDKSGVALGQEPSTAEMAGLTVLAKQSNSWTVAELVIYYRALQFHGMDIAKLAQALHGSKTEVQVQTYVDDWQRHHPPMKQWLEQYAAVNGTQENRAEKRAERTGHPVRATWLVDGSGKATFFKSRTLASKFLGVSTQWISRVLAMPAGQTIRGHTILNRDPNDLTAGGGNDDAAAPPAAAPPAAAPTKTSSTVGTAGTAGTAGTSRPEKKYDVDGKAYTLQQFIAYYGGTVNKPPVAWHNAWANKSDVGKRWITGNGQTTTSEKDGAGPTSNQPSQIKLVPQYPANRPQTSASVVSPDPTHPRPSMITISSANAVPRSVAGAPQSLKGMSVAERRLFLLRGGAAPLTQSAGQMINGYQNRDPNELTTGVGNDKASEPTQIKLVPRYPVNRPQTRTAVVSPGPTHPQPSMVTTSSTNAVPRSVAGAPQSLKGMSVAERRLFLLRGGAAPRPQIAASPDVFVLNSKVPGQDSIDQTYGPRHDAMTRVSSASSKRPLAEEDLSKMDTGNALHAHEPNLGETSSKVTRACSCCGQSRDRHGFSVREWRNVETPSRCKICVQKANGEAVSAPLDPAELAGKIWLSTGDRSKRWEAPQGSARSKPAQDLAIARECWQCKRVRDRSNFTDIEWMTWDRSLCRPASSCSTCIEASAVAAAAADVIKAALPSSNQLPLAPPLASGQKHKGRTPVGPHATRAKGQPRPYDPADDTEHTDKKVPSRSNGPTKAMPSYNLKGQKRITTMYVQKVGETKIVMYPGQLDVRKALCCSTTKLTALSRTPERRGIIHGHYISFWRSYADPMPKLDPDGFAYEQGIILPSKKHVQLSAIQKNNRIRNNHAGEPLPERAYAASITPSKATDTAACALAEDTPHSTLPPSTIAPEPNVSSTVVHTESALPHSAVTSEKNQETTQMAVTHDGSSVDGATRIEQTAAPPPPAIAPATLASADVVCSSYQPSTTGEERADHDRVQMEALAPSSEHSSMAKAPVADPEQVRMSTGALAAKQRWGQPVHRPMKCSGQGGAQGVDHTRPQHRKLTDNAATLKPAPEGPGRTSVSVAELSEAPQVQTANSIEGDIHAQKPVVDASIAETASVVPVEVPDACLNCSPFRAHCSHTCGKKFPKKKAGGSRNRNAFKRKGNAKKMQIPAQAVLALGLGPDQLEPSAASAVTGVVSMSMRPSASLELLEVPLPQQATIVLSASSSPTRNGGVADADGYAQVSVAESSSTDAPKARTEVAEIAEPDNDSIICSQGLENLVTSALDVDASDDDLHDPRHKLSGPGPECKVCEVNDAKPNVLCTVCGGVYHLQCIGLNSLPKGAWFCDTCKLPDDGDNNTSQASAAAVAAPVPPGGAGDAAAADPPAKKKRKRGRPDPFKHPRSTCQVEVADCSGPLPWTVERFTSVRALFAAKGWDLGDPALVKRCSAAVKAGGPAVFEGVAIKVTMPKVKTKDAKSVVETTKNPVSKPEARSKIGFAAAALCPSERAGLEYLASKAQGWSLEQLTSYYLWLQTHGGSSKIAANVKGKSQADVLTFRYYDTWQNNADQQKVEPPLPMQQWLKEFSAKHQSSATASSLISDDKASAIPVGRHVLQPAATSEIGPSSTQLSSSERAGLEWVASAAKKWSLDQLTNFYLGYKAHRPDKLKGKAKAVAFEKMGEMINGKVTSDIAQYYHNFKYRFGPMERFLVSFSVDPGNGDKNGGQSKRAKPVPTRDKAAFTSPLEVPAAASRLATATKLPSTTATVHIATASKTPAAEPVAAAAATPGSPASTPQPRNRARTQLSAVEVQGIDHIASKAVTWSSKQLTSYYMALKRLGLGNVTGKVSGTDLAKISGSIDGKSTGDVKVYFMNWNRRFPPIEQYLNTPKMKDNKHTKKRRAEAEPPTDAKRKAKAPRRIRIQNVDLLEDWRRENVGATSVKSKFWLGYLSKKCEMTPEQVQKWVRAEHATYLTLLE